MNEKAFGIRQNNRGKYIAVGGAPFDLYRVDEAPTRQQQTTAYLYNAPGLGPDSNLTESVLQQLFTEPDFQDQSRPLSCHQERCLNSVVSLVRERIRLQLELDRLTREFREQPGADGT